MFSGGTGLTSMPTLPSASPEKAPFNGTIDAEAYNDANKWAVSANKFGMGYEIGEGIVKTAFQWWAAAKQFALMNRQMDAVDNMIKLKGTVAEYQYNLQTKALDHQRDIAEKSQDTALALADKEVVLREYEIDAKKTVALRRADNDRLNGIFGQNSYFGGRPAYAA